MEKDVEKTNLQLHLDRLNNWKIVRWFIETNIVIKIIVTILLLFTPLIPVVVLMLVGSLIFIKSKSNSVWKGVISFSISTFLQIATIFFSFILIAFNDSGDVLTSGVLISISIMGWLINQPLYILTFNIHNLNWKRKDGMAYIILDVVYLITLIIWNFKIGN